MQFAIHILAVVHDSASPAKAICVFAVIVLFQCHFLAFQAMGSRELHEDNLLTKRKKIVLFVAT